VAGEAVALGDDNPLGGYTVLYLTGHEKFELDKSERAALKRYLSGGGFLIADATGGSLKFDESFRGLVKKMGLKLEELGVSDGIKTGQMGEVLGYDITRNVKFRHSMRIRRLLRPWADLFGIYSGGRLVGIYSPFDMMFSLTGYDAYGCKGYEAADARAVATNIFLYLSSFGEEAAAEESAEKDKTEKEEKEEPAEKTEAKKPAEEGEAKKPAEKDEEAEEVKAE